jgi:hypothetical protein
VLHAPRRIALELVRDVVAVLVLPLDPHGRRTLDRDEHALERQAALVVGQQLLPALDDLRVDDRRRPVVAAAVEDEDAAKDSDLGRRQPDPDCILHERRHALHQAAEVVVELLDGLRLHSQRRVWILADLRECELAPGVSLGVDLFVDDHLTFSLGHKGHTSGVERKERESIMRQGVTRAETPRDRAERESLEQDLLESPLTGRPLPRRLRNFRPAADAAVRALGGPLAWMRRLREIELRTAEHEERLGAAYALVREEYANDAEGFRDAWQDVARAWSFRDVNGLIERHNRNFPAEARLPMNPRTGDFVPVNGRPYTRAPLDERWILERFPA